MIARLLPILSSIKVKLFLWFWLITICSIAITRFVSSQLSEEMIELPVHGYDIKHIKSFVRRANNGSTIDLETLRQRQQLKQERGTKQYSIWLKALNSNQVYATGKTPPEDLLAFIRSTTFSAPLTWQFQDHRLTGPIEIQTSQGRIQLFTVKATKKPRHLSMAFMRLPFAVRIAIPMVVSFILCWWLARTLSRPISNIAASATQFGEGDFSARVEKEQARSDELGHLARSFNTMATKLEQSMSAQQRLLGDVSHELRSPLTRLQMALGLAQSNAEKPEVQADYLARCELEVSRLDRMIGDVLALSRLENTLQHAQLEQCNLNSIIEMLVEDANFIARTKSVIIDYQPTEDVMLNIDSQLIASALGNIINNAVKYTPEHSRVEINVERKQNILSINIADNGEGVPEAALPHLFEPFYRVADARDRTSGGTGLGLAIAKQAITLHQGNIFAKNKADGGLLITVELPLQ